MDSHGQTHTVNLREFRRHEERSWQLPPWGHLIGKCVMPLFVSAEEKLFPVGTAFILSRRVVLIATAEHNIREAIKRCWRNGHFAAGGDLAGAVALSDGIGLWVLYHHLQPSGRVDLLLWPLETVHGPQPTDIVVGFPKAASNLATLSCDVSFDIPQPGSQVLCVGYSGFSFPEDGIPMAAVRDATFDWRTDYGHELWVVEGAVLHLFAQRFAGGFVRGPCFSLDAEIPHGLSGGPTFNDRGAICGVNSAGATAFLDRPASLVSPLFPILGIDVKFGFSVGPVRIDATQPIAEFVTRGSIKARGTESSVHFSRDEDGSLRVGVQTSATFGPVFDDFAGLQDGRPPTLVQGTVYGLRTRRSDEDGAPKRLLKNAPAGVDLASKERHQPGRHDARR